MVDFNIAAVLTPEVALAVLALLLLAIGLLIPPSARKGMMPLTVFGLLGVLGYTIYDFFYGQQSTFLGGLYYHDHFAVYFKILFLAAALLVVLSSGNYIQKLPKYRGEFYSLILAATLGMMMMAGAGELITLYVGLELMTISFYILVAYLSDNPRSSEAGVKYLVLGASSSAILLYGIPRVIIGENRTFRGEEDLLLSRGVIVQVVDDADCAALLGAFIRTYPAVWNEDIGR